MRQAIHRASPNREYVTLSSAFDFFNRRLFEGKLPPAIITFQRKAGSRGYYSAKRFEGRTDPTIETDEVALHPGTFRGRTDTEILSTLVHEMVHLWQQHFGTPSRGRYHNHEWAAKMEALGLMPSHTGEPGGRRVGQQMTHFILPGQPFDASCRELLGRGIVLSWQSRENEPRQRTQTRRSKTKYTCPDCGLNAWAKPGAPLVCGDCARPMESEEPT